MDKEKIDNIKKDLKSIKLKIETLEKGLDSFGLSTKEISDTPKHNLPQGVSFEDKRKEIENEIEKAEKRLELLFERKKRIEQLKKEIEDREAKAKTPEERKDAEQQRRIVEDERNLVEENLAKKQEEVKLMKLQLKDWDKFYYEKTEWNPDFEKSLDSLILEEEKQNLMIDLEKIQTRTTGLKNLLHDTAAQREVLNKKLSEINKAEDSAEKEIKSLEEKINSTSSEDARTLEDQRRAAEERRRELEQARWEAEDELSKLEDVYTRLKAEYQVMPLDINNIKEKLALINKKMDEQI
jgi:chromosome segregation ATPase